MVTNFTEFYIKQKMVYKSLHTQGKVYISNAII